jgi:acyl-coenzyme A thioesterase PaaI-like protein
MEPRGGAEFGALTDALRLVQDRVTGTDAPADVLAAAAVKLHEAAALLADHEAADGEQHAGFRLDLPGRGHPLLTPCFLDTLADDHIEGRVTLTRTHLSAGGRAHAGAVALLFGEVLGVLSVLGGRAPARNAALHVNYRKGTPNGRELRISGRVVEVDGRKIHVHGELYDGATLLADAQGLYVKVPS